MRSDSGIAMIDATNTRNAEFATRSESSWLTGCCVAAEAPKSNVRTPFSHCVYWVKSEALRGSCSRSAATRSGVAVLPSIAVAASPGSAMTAAKMTSDTSQSVSRPRPIRRRIMLVDTTGLLAIRADGLHGGRFSFGVGELGGDEVLRETQVFGDDVGRGGIAPLEGLEQPDVVGHVGRERIRRVVAQQHPRLGGEGLERADEARAARKRDELLVEADVGVDDGLGDLVCGVRDLRELLERRPQVREVPGRRVEDPPRRTRLDRLASHVDVEPVGERHHAHEGAAVGLVVDQSLLDELTDGLAHRAAPGAERRRQRDLAQRLALRDPTLDDRLA